MWRGISSQKQLTFFQRKPKNKSRQNAILEVTPPVSTPAGSIASIWFWLVDVLEGGVSSEGSADRHWRL